MTRDIDDSSENVLHDWSGQEEPSGEESAGPPWGTATVAETHDEGAAAVAAAPEHEPAEPGQLADDLPPVEDGAERAPGPRAEAEAAPETPDEPAEGAEAERAVALVSPEHAAGELGVPDGYTVLEGVADGSRRAVAVVAARFNADVTSRLLERAHDELESAGVRKDAVTVLVVPGAFELPLAATALAKTRRYACIVALGCVIRGETPHFDYVASEAASGLQLAALETGVPVSFGVLTLDRADQADARIEKGAEAVRSALEMADVFSHLRAAAGR